MSLLWMDDFDHYTTATLKQNYNNADASIAAGRNGNAVSMGVLNYIAKDLGVNAKTIIMGFAHYTGSWSYSPVIYIRDGDTNQIYLVFNGAGTPVLIHGNGTPIAIGTFPLVANAWYFIEIKVTIDNAGSAEVRVGGNTCITYSGDTQNTTNAYANFFQLAGDRSSNLFDDLYVCDDSGSTNNDFLGDHKIENILPDGDGYIAQWAPSAGINWQNVDDPNTSAPCPDGDSTVNISATPSDTDSFSFQNLATTSGTIAGIQVSCNVKKDDAGSRSLKFFVRIGGNNYYSDTFTLLDSYRYFAYCWDINPATSVPWMISDINSAEFGYVLVS